MTNSAQTLLPCWAYCVKSVHSKASTCRRSRPSAAQWMNWSTDWANMLGHQLPKLPSFESFWSVMPAFFSWLTSGVTARPAPAAPMESDEQLFRPAIGLLRRAGAVGSSSLEAIRFAAANRLCIDLRNQGSVPRMSRTRCAVRVPARSCYSPFGHKMVNREAIGSIDRRCRHNR